MRPLTSLFHADTVLECHKVNFGIGASLHRAPDDSQHHTTSTPSSLYQEVDFAGPARSSVISNLSVPEER